MIQILPGVLSTSTPKYLHENIYLGESLEFIEHCKTCKNEYHDDCWESLPDETYIISFKYNYKTEKYNIDPSAEYSAIINDQYTQVVNSKYISLASKASPCYPDQCDLDTNGEIMAFTLPPLVWGSGDHLPIYKQIKSSSTLNNNNNQPKLVLESPGRTNLGQYFIKPLKTRED